VRGPLGVFRRLSGSGRPDRGGGRDCPVSEGRIAGWPGLAAGAWPRPASSYAEPVGSSPRLSDSQIAALSGRRFPRSPAGTAGPGADALDADAGTDAADADADTDAADADAGASYRLDMTGSSSARHVTSTPAAMIASAPAKATPRHWDAANARWAGNPNTPVPAACPWPPRSCCRCPTRS